MTACSGEPIPRIQYTPEEVRVWGTALSKLKEMYPKHACREFNRSFPRFNFRCVAGGEGGLGQQFCGCSVFVAVDKWTFPVPP